MKHAASRDLHAYWESLRGGASMPDRADFDPLAIRQWLDWVAMVDADCEAGAPVLVAGAGLSSLFCGELRGRSFLSLWRLGERAKVAELMETASLNGAALCLPVEARPLDRGPVELELLILPFSHHGRPGARALCSLSMAQLPSWIGLLPAGHLAFSAQAPRIREPRPDVSRPTAINSRDAVSRL